MQLQGLLKGKLAFLTPSVGIKRTQQQRESPAREGESQTGQRRQKTVEPDAAVNQSAVYSSIFESGLPAKFQPVNPMLKQLLNRQKSGRRQEATMQQKKLAVLEQITDPSYNRTQNARKLEEAKK